MAHTNSVIVVGSGPAGMMAAIRAAQEGASVLLLERRATAGNKLLLTGKGRCNLTNACPPEDLLPRFLSNGQFLRDAFKIFSNQDLMRFFEERGLALVVERQERVFPATARSISVLTVLQKELAKLKVQVQYRIAVKDILCEGKSVRGVLTTQGEKFEAKKIILATGGASYRFTGSDGEGIVVAGALGHRLVPLRAGLVALITTEKFITLQGLTLKNVRLTFSCGKKKLVTEIGEGLFTETGISGPLVLTNSGVVADWLAEKAGPVTISIDFKPGLTIEQLDGRLLREFQENSKKSIAVLMGNLAPKSLGKVFIEKIKMNPLKKVSQITLAERKQIVSMLKGFTVTVASCAPLEEAMVTRGGVSVKDIDPRTMGSRVIKGLYFAGEMIDVDADTGGFNLQAAFSTGYLAGESAAKV